MTAATTSTTLHITPPTSTPTVLPPSPPPSATTSLNSLTGSLRPTPRPSFSYKYQPAASLSSQQIIDAASYSTTPSGTPPRVGTPPPMRSAAVPRSVPTTAGVEAAAVKGMGARCAGCDACVCARGEQVREEEREGEGEEEKEHEREHECSTFRAADYHRPVPTHEALRRCRAGGDSGYDSTCWARVEV